MEILELKCSNTRKINYITVIKWQKKSMNSNEDLLIKLSSPNNREKQN